MALMQEFREFIARGNVVDLAVAVVIGGAFGKIVTALVDGILMPALGALTGGVSVAAWKYVVTPEHFDASGAKVAETAIRYGQFLQAAIDFLLIAFVVFLLLKAYNRVRRADAPAPAATPEDVVLLREIRDLLRAPR